MSAKGSIKGSAVASLPLFVKGRFGETAFLQWLESLPEDCKDTFSSQIIATEWYPIDSHFLVPTESICNMFFQGDLKGAWEAGYFNAENAIKGTYSTFIRKGDPNFFIATSGQLFLKVMYDPSESHVVVNEKNQALYRATVLPRKHPIIEMRVAGFIECALKASEAKEIKVSMPKALSRGDPYTDWSMTWKMK